MNTLLKIIASSMMVMAMDIVTAMVLSQQKSLQRSQLRSQRKGRILNYQMPLLHQLNRQNPLMISQKMTMKPRK
jgi:hypothetical protein